MFGFGWVVVALAAAVLAGTLAAWARLGPGWALLPIGALVLPSTALALGGVHVEPSTTSVTVAPRAAAALVDYKSGLGLLTVDLRRTALPASGTIPLKIDAGVRRTLIALPHDRCVHVTVAPPPARHAAARRAAGRRVGPRHAGGDRLRPARRASPPRAGRADARDRFSSAGGS